MKEVYKELRKKLKNEFERPSSRDYNLLGGVGVWVKQCGIYPTADNLKIICTIFGSVPYPYQESDRLFVLKYLKENKYKRYKEEYGDK